MTMWFCFGCATFLVPGMKFLGENTWFDLHLSYPPMVVFGHCYLVKHCMELPSTLLIFSLTGSGNCDTKDVVTFLKAMFLKNLLVAYVLADQWLISLMVIVCFRSWFFVFVFVFVFIFIIWLCASWMS